MTIAFTSAPTPLATTSVGATLSGAVNAGTGANRILVVNAIHERDVDQTITGMTYAGVAMAQRVHEPGTNDTAFVQRQDIWTLANPAEGSNTLEASYSDTGQDAVLIPRIYTGDDPILVGAVASDNQADGIDSHLSVELTTTQPNAMIVWGSDGRNANSGPFTPDANCTERVDGVVSSGNAGIAYTAGDRGPEASAGAYSVGATATGSSSTSDKTVAAIELYESAGGAAPDITSIDPESGQRGQTLDVTINGADFVDGADADFGAGITVNSTSFVNATELTAGITIAGGASLGLRSVTVTNPDEQEDTLVDAFEVLAVAVTGNTLTLAEDAPASLPVDSVLRLVSGAGSVQQRPIVRYDGDTKVATVSPRWRTNMLLRSEEFDLAPWEAGGGSVAVTPDSVVSPDGTVTADTLEFAAVANANIHQDLPPTNQQYSFSIWLRSDAPTTIQFQAASVPAVQYDSADQTMNLTTVWQRFSFTFTASGITTDTNLRLHLVTRDSVARTVYAFGAQLEQASSVGDYIKTEAAAITLPDATTDYEVRGAFDPYERGTLLSKWLARNPYYTRYGCGVRDGLMSQTLDEMRLRRYMLDKIDGPNEGVVALVATDLFGRVDARQAMAPRHSRGRLAAPLSSTDFQLTLDPVGIGDLEYPAAGRAAIKDEAVAFTRVGDVLTLTERGVFDTPVEDHDQQDTVQLILSFEAMAPSDIADHLLVNYTNVDAPHIADWSEQAAAIVDLYTGHIAVPTPVEDLVAELQKQAGFTLYPDPVLDKIRMTALRAGVVSPTVNDRNWIKAGSFTWQRLHERRVSEVAVHFGLRNPLGDLDDPKNYHSVAVVTDPFAEGKYGYALHEIFSRWIPQFARDPALRCGNRLLTLYVDPPITAEFVLSAARDGELDVARYFALQVKEIQDQLGAERPVTMATVSLARGEREIKAKAQQVAFTVDQDDGVRRVHIDNNSANLNLRQIHDQQFLPPTGDEIIEFYVTANVLVGSTSAGAYALRTGTWPDMYVRPKLFILGRVQGKGGVGGTGGGGHPTLLAPAAGGLGGPALLFEAFFDFDMSEGQVWGGAGGGGGGGWGQVQNVNFGGGGGGGGGCGNEAALGAAGKISWTDGGGGSGAHGQPGTSSTVEAGGAGGAGGHWTNIFGTAFGGKGGDGGGPGEDGQAGTDGNNLGVVGAAGGAAGNAIEGVFFINWLSTEGDIRGGIV